MLHAAAGGSAIVEEDQRKQEGYSRQRKLVQKYNDWCETHSLFEEDGLLGMGKERQKLVKDKACPW